MHLCLAEKTMLSCSHLLSTAHPLQHAKRQQQRSVPVSDVVPLVTDHVKHVCSVQFFS
jgi:hypothetical protein